MKLENQVTSLELSKRLKELRVKQKSLFYWSEVVDNFHEKPSLLYSSKGKIPENKSGFYKATDGSGWEENFFSAFTVAELGEYLKDVSSEVMEKLPQKYKDMDDNEMSHFLFSADKWAEVLIYLLENNLLSSNEVK